MLATANVRGATLAGPPTPAAEALFIFQIAGDADVPGARRGGARDARAAGLSGARGDGRLDGRHDGRARDAVAPDRRARPLNVRAGAIVHRSSCGPRAAAPRRDPLVARGPPAFPELLRATESTRLPHGHDGRRGGRRARLAQRLRAARRPPARPGRPGDPRPRAGARSTPPSRAAPRTPTCASPRDRQQNVGTRDRIVHRRRRHRHLRPRRPHARRRRVGLRRHERPHDGRASPRATRSALEQAKANRASQLRPRRSSRPTPGNQQGEWKSPIKTDPFTVADPRQGRAAARRERGRAQGEGRAHRQLERCSSCARRRRS